MGETYKIFIVSNCPEFTIQYFMDWADIKDLITDTMAHGMNFKSKHENIQHLIDKHDLKSPVYVGDTDSDRKQSDLVPMPFVYVDYGFGEVQNYAFRFSSFTELTDFFRNNK